MISLMAVLRVFLAILGLAIALGAVFSAVRTTVLPRAVPSRISRVVFVLLRKAFDLRLGRSASYEQRDRIYANYGPFALLGLLQSWLILVYGGFALADGAVENEGARQALRLSGSSIFTLGFDAPHAAPATFLVFFEASLGLLLVALLISYLPTIYGAFSKREAMVNKLQVRAAAVAKGPPDGGTLIVRSFLIQGENKLTPLWTEMESWFVDIQESHSTFPVLVFFRSPDPGQSWITAAGAVLDAAALLDSTVDQPRVAEANLCLRAGFLALQAIGNFYRVDFDRDPAPDDPISIRREEYDEVVNRVEAAGVPIKADREQAWRDFAGWRVNYDRVLIAIATLVQAPYAPWSSDRSLSERVVPKMILRHPHERIGS